MSLQSSVPEPVLKSFLAAKPDITEHLKTGSI